LAAAAILLTPPILVNSILLFRLLAFYPIQLTPRLTLIAVLTPTCICKLARLASLIAFLVTYPLSRSTAPAYVTLPGLVWGRGPWILSLIALQALDNSCVFSFYSSTCPDQIFSVMSRQCSCTNFIALATPPKRQSVAPAVSTVFVIVRVPPPSSPRPRSRGHIFSCACRFCDCARELCGSVRAHPPTCSWTSLDISSLSGLPSTLRSLCL
jgi:hypothetical protein